MKRFLKLINNERTNVKVTSKKALAVCDETAGDYCYGEDYAACSSHAYDKCYQHDLAACIEGAHDFCESYSYDTEACYGPGNVDGNRSL